MLDCWNQIPCVCRHTWPSNTIRIRTLNIRRRNTVHTDSFCQYPPHFLPHCKHLSSTEPVCVPSRSVVQPSGPRCYSAFVAACHIRPHTTEQPFAFESLRIIIKRAIASSGLKQSSLLGIEFWHRIAVWYYLISIVLALLTMQHWVADGLDLLTAKRVRSTGV